MTKRHQHRPYCDDWACPSLWTCARSWGRSEPYWRFDPEADEREGVATYRGPRDQRFDACDHYERDQPRPWLQGVFRSLLPTERPIIPAGFRLHLVQNIAGDGEGEC